MIHIVLVHPEIPMNTGNIARTCACTGAHLHLVRPLGFDISDKAVKRAGLDYWHLVDISVYDGLEDLFSRHPEASDIWLATTKAPRSYAEAEFRDGCWLFFGKETAGLDEDLIRENLSHAVRLPMLERIRSLNLSNTVAVAVYEVLRQWDFEGFCTEGFLKGEK